MCISIGPGLEDQELYCLSNGTCVTDGESSYNAGCADQIAMAEIYAIWQPTWLHDARVGRHCNTWDVCWTGSAIRLLPMPGVKDGETAVLLRKPGWICVWAACSDGGDACGWEGSTCAAVLEVSGGSVLIRVLGY